MYVIATVICPNFHFSVSPHVPFLNLLFEQIANSNEYLLAKIDRTNREFLTTGWCRFGTTESTVMCSEHRTFCIRIYYSCSE